MVILSSDDASELKLGRSERLWTKKRLGPAKAFCGVIGVHWWACFEDFGAVSQLFVGRGTKLSSACSLI